MNNPADLDHPCKETCSRWQQGYERGQEAVRRIAIAHETRSAQEYADLAKQMERMRAILKSAREVILWSIDQRSLHIKDQIDECLKEEEC